MSNTLTSPNGTKLTLVATRKTTPKEDSEAKVVRITLNRKTRLEENKEFLKNKNVKAFLDTLALTEGGDYDLKYGGVKGKKNDKWRISDYSTHPGAGADGKTTAAGRYQINKATWKECGESMMGLTDFTPGTQDLIAVEILRGRGAIAPLIKGDMPTAVKAASSRWESLPEGENLPNRPINGKPSMQPYTKYPDVIEMFKSNGGVVGNK